MMKNITCGLLVLLSAFSLSCQKHSTPPPAKKIAIQIREVPEYRETNYYYQGGTFRVEWTTYALEHNQNVVKHRVQGDVTLEDMLPVLSSMIETVFDPAKNTHAGKIDTLAWGRIAPDHSVKNTEISKRLVVAAALSETWDRNKGAVKTGVEINTWVKDLANQADIFYEVPQAFAAHGMKIKIASVEKVLVSRADTLPYFAQLKKFGIKAEDKLPWDGQVWFAVQK